MVTLPVKVILPLSWLPANELALMLIGWFLSACLACARPLTPSAARNRNSNSTRVRSEGAVDIGQELQWTGIEIGLHADAAQYRAGLLNYARGSGGHALVLRPHGGVGGVDFGFGDFCRGRTAHVHLADQLDRVVVGTDPRILRGAVPGGAVAGDEEIFRRVDVQRVVAFAAREVRRGHGEGESAVLCERVQGEIVQLVAGTRRPDDRDRLRWRPEPHDQQLGDSGGDRECNQPEKRAAVPHVACAATMKSHTSRAAPWPPLARVCQCAASSTSGRASATATANPHTDMGARSGKSSPT